MGRKGDRRLGERTAWRTLRIHRAEGMFFAIGVAGEELAPVRQIRVIHVHEDHHPGDPAQMSRNEAPKSTKRGRVSVGLNHGDRYGSGAEHRDIFFPADRPPLRA